MDHIRLLGIQKFAAGSDPSRQLSHRDQCAGDFATTDVPVGVAGDEQLLVQREGGGIAEDVQRLQNLRREKATQHLVAADPLEERDYVGSLAGIVARGFNGGRDECMMGSRRLQVFREQRPRLSRVALGEREKREITAAERGLRVGDDRAEPGHAPPRANQCGGGRVLPPLELRHAEGHDVRIEKRPATLQHREQPAIDFGQRGLECLRVRAARERERLPSHLTEILLAPDRFQFRGIAGRQQALESCGEPTEPANRIHARNVESAWILRYPIRSLNLASLMRRCRALLTATLLLTACSGASSGPIVLGLAGPFAQPRGVSMRRAAELAVKEINARGGVRGRPLALRIMDDSGRPDLAIRIAQQLVDDPAVVAVIGHLNSSAALAAGRIYGEARRPVVMISPSASSPDLSGINPFVFRACPSDVSHGAQLARYARHMLNARRVGVMYLDDDYGRGLRLSFVGEFKRLGGEVIEEDPMLSTTPSLEPYVTRLQQSGGVDALMLATDLGGAQLALREMSRAGVHWTTLGGDALSGIEQSGPLAEGVRMSVAYLVDQAGDRNAQFVAAYARAYPGERPDHRGATTYDIVHLLATVLRDAGPQRRAVRDRVARVGRDLPPFEGVTGRIAFDDRGDVPTKSVVIGTVREGRVVTEPGQ